MLKKTLILLTMLIVVYTFAEGPTLTECGGTFSQFVNGVTGNTRNDGEFWTSHNSVLYTDEQGTRYGSELQIRTGGNQVDELWYVFMAGKNPGARMEYKDNSGQWKLLDQVSGMGGDNFHAVVHVPKRTYSKDVTLAFTGKHYNHSENYNVWYSVSEKEPESTLGYSGTVAYLEVDPDGTLRRVVK